MLTTRRLLQYIFLIPIVILILLCPLVISTAAENSSLDYEAPIYEAPIYEVPFSENIQHEIGNLCENNRLSYELVLAVYQVEGDNSTQTEDIKAKIEKLASYRDYWAAQGYCDEIVFDLMLLSEQRGIEGCAAFMENNNSYKQDDYVQKVTEYKYYLEQIDCVDESM
jgi:hypothetical protein